MHIETDEQTLQALLNLPITCTAFPINETVRALHLSPSQVWSFKPSRSLVIQPSLPATVEESRHQSQIEAEQKCNRLIAESLQKQF